MSVDKTAGAILAWSIDRNEYVRNPNDVEQSAYISDLQAMAKLWLKRKNILVAMQDFQRSVDGGGGAAFAAYAFDRFNQAIVALEGNGE